jgi:hypothetical protein
MDYPGFMEHLAISIQHHAYSGAESSGESFRKRTETRPRFDGLKRHR